MRIAAVLAVLLAAACSSTPAPVRADAAVTYDSNMQLPEALRLEVLPGHSYTDCPVFGTELVAALEGTALVQAAESFKIDPAMVFPGSLNGVSLQAGGCYAAAYELPRGAGLPQADSTLDYALQGGGETASMQTSNFLKPMTVELKSPPSGHVRRGQSVLLLIKPSVSEVGTVTLRSPTSYECGEHAVAVTPDASIAQALVYVAVPGDLPEACNGRLDLVPSSSMKPLIVRCEGLGTCDATLRTAPPTATVTLDPS
jgi:hypothetical protein